MPAWRPPHDVQPGPLSELAAIDPLACPYLGLRGDPRSRFLFATPAHRCHVKRRPAPIEIGHQGRYCLSAEYPACPRYRAPAPNVVDEGRSDLTHSQPRRSPDGQLSISVTDTARPVTAVDGATIRTAVSGNAEPVAADQGPQLYPRGLGPPLVEPTSPITLPRGPDAMQQRDTKKRSTTAARRAFQVSLLVVLAIITVGVIAWSAMGGPLGR